MLSDDELEILFARLRRRDPLEISEGVEVASVGERDLNPGFMRRRAGVRSRPASVLVPLIDRPDELTVLLTQRTDHLPDHAGQVSFPGGSREAHDSDEIDTALRETEEEVGIARQHVDVIGAMDLYQTSSGFDITPVVGVVRPDFQLDVDAHEVADVFEVPLTFFLDPSNHATESRRFGLHRFHYYAMPYNGYFIWGATAAMLVNLSRVLTAFARSEPGRS